MGTQQRKIPMFSIILGLLEDLALVIEPSILSVFAVPDEGPSLVRKFAQSYMTCFHIASILKKGIWLSGLASLFP
jgi:hypothetical protein